MQNSGQSFIKENCHNSRTSNDIGVKFGPVTKINKRSMVPLNKLTVKSCQKFVISLPFLQFMANLDQYRSHILDAWSVKLTISFNRNLLSYKN